MLLLVVFGLLISGLAFLSLCGFAGFAMIRQSLTHDATGFAHFLGAGAHLVCLFALWVLHCGLKCSTLPLLGFYLAGLFCF